MNIVISCSELLFEIIKNSIDIQDWINFMLTSHIIYDSLHITFLLQKFKFMRFWNQKLPNCIMETGKIKCIINATYRSNYYITTNERCIKAHCLLSSFDIFETYGLFFKGLIFNNNNFIPVIDHIKIFDFISDNEVLCHNQIIKKIYFTKQYIRTIDPMESRAISKKFIRSQNTQYYNDNIAQINKQLSRKIKDNIAGQLQAYICNIQLKTRDTLAGFKLCGFCGELCGKTNQDHKNLHTDGHRWYDPDNYNRLSLI